MLSTTIYVSSCCCICGLIITDFVATVADGLRHPFFFLCCTTGADGLRHSLAYLFADVAVVNTGNEGSRQGAERLHMCVLMLLYVSSYY